MISCHTVSFAGVKRSGCKYFEYKLIITRNASFLHLRAATDSPFEILKDWIPAFAGIQSYICTIIKVLYSIILKFAKVRFFI